MATIFAITVPDWLQPIADSLQASMNDMQVGAEKFLPKLVAMIFIVVVGYVLSFLVQLVAKTVIRKVGIDVIADKIGLHEILQSIGIRLPASMVLGKALFWTLMLVFLKAGIDVLQMESISQSFSSLMGYIPNLIAAMVVLLAGLMLAKFVQGMVVAAAERFGVDYGSAIGQLVYGVIVIIVASVAVAQLQLKTDLVDRFLEITFMAIGAALALALGFGTRDTARHVVAGVYARESFLAGTKVAVGEQSGSVLAVQAVNTKIAAEDGTIIYVPNAQLIEMVVRQDATDT